MTPSPPHSAWINTYHLPQQGSARVFAFPYSGGGSAIFSQWALAFRDSPIDFIGIQLPGRENRLQEVPLSNLRLLIEQLLPEITPWLHKPFVCFGHSLGALIAFELCRALRAQQLPLPRHLFTSAFRAPDVPNPNRALHRLPKAEIIAGLRGYDGTPEAVLNDAKVMALFLPLLRADFSLHETYQYQPGEALPLPITALSGKDDTIARPETMQNWRQQTAAHFEQVCYAGGHFFLNQQQQRDAIIQRLTRALSDS